MKTKILVDDRYGLNFPVKRQIKKIVNLLFEKDEIRKNSATAPYNVETVSLGIVFSNDKEIKEVNKNYRNKDLPTDVITFALFADDENKFVFNKTAELGEIIISVDTAIRQAANGLETEIFTLICHGILHLLGFDHSTDEDYNFVVRTQEDIISRIYEKVPV